MTLSVTQQADPLAAKLVLQTSATATADNNVTGAATTVFMVDIDNTANAAQPVYLKLYNNNAPTVGTTPPDCIYMVAGGVRRVYAITEGVAFSTGLSFACVVTGGTSGTSSPSSATVVRVLCS